MGGSTAVAVPHTLEDDQAGSILNESSEFIRARRRFAAIDVETANAQRASICAVGIAIVEEGEVAEQHHWLVRPPDGYQDFSAFNTRIHGIRAADVSDSQAFSSLMPQVSDLLNDLPVVAHNASFDIGAIRLACLASATQMPTLHYSCTMALSRATLQLPSYSLPFCAEALGINMGRHHDALADAEAAAQIALALLDREAADDLDALLERCHMRWGLLTEVEWLRSRFSHGAASAVKGTQPANPDADPSHQLYGRSVALTGDLVVMTRQQAFEQLAGLGGIGQKNVTKTTQILVVGDLNPAVLRPGEAATGKMRKAFELQAKGQQIEVMSGYDFLAMLD
ncbi:MAG: exonuclease [Actinomycetia bacterium]|nr:exonuclease [Actinomycetes bacterium]